jgi:putative endonuclease
LERKGYQILAANYRCQFGEIDLIAEESHELVFIEVKSRTGSAYGRGLESITTRKKHHILRTAWYYLEQLHQSHRPFRFDALEISFDYDGNPVKAELIQNAFVFDS